MFEQLLPRVIAVARDAGKAIMQIYDQPAGDVTLKSDQSPLTEADLASNRIILDGLANLKTDWPVLSEESTHTPVQQRSSWQRFWLVDPLDGTKEFIKRNGEFTVNIALVDQGAPVLGVVYAPALDICYSGAKGQGAFVQHGNDQAVRIEVKHRHANESLRVVSSRSHSDARTSALLSHLGDHECISMGSSLKLCLVAEGKAHLYPRLGPTMEWDTAAAHAVVKAAGGVVCDLSGKELDYNKADLHNPEFFVLGRSETALLTTIRNCI
ncbi:MAG: 3'(2'),5'-bisphosphate nucleotidase CysQ [Gammaproteobacteria bacterium]